MIYRTGIILIDTTTIIFRIYEYTNDTLELFYFSEKYFDETSNTDDVALLVANFFSSRYADHIAEWKICARNAEAYITNEIELLTGIPIEYLTPTREQELLCKGILSEFC